MWNDECWDDVAAPSPSVSGTMPSCEFVATPPQSTAASEYRQELQESAHKSHHSERRPHRKDRSQRGKPTAGADSVRMEVRGEVVPKIIGKGGSKIREIRDQTRARIDIDNNRTETGMGVITISGAPGDIEAAREAIDAIVNSSSSNHSRTSRDGYSGSAYDRRDRRDDGRGGRNESSNSNRGKSSYSSRGSGYDFNSRSRNDYGFNHSAYNAYNCEPSDEIIDWTSLNRMADEAALERWAKFPPLIKMFYNERKEVEEMSAAEVAQFRASNNNIVVERTFKDVEGDRKPIPNPVSQFDQAFGEYPDLMEELHKQKFTTPTPIQAQAWPILLRGEDMIGIAQTGTGKTLAFLLPALIHIDGQPMPRADRGGPNVLVLAPTRELALQIEKEVAKYQFRNIQAVCLYGGGDRRAQINVVRRGIEILIATPGRLNDLVQEGVVNVSSITYLVLDEADRMLDMGFEPQIRKVLLDVRPDRQTVMTSATWPDGVRRLAQSYMHDPIQVYVGTLDLAATHTVTQLIEVMDEEDKYHRINEFVRDMLPTDKVIIFCGKKTRADDLSSDFVLSGIHCQSIHGNREQSDREQALEDIKRGTVNILIATDVASRGLDIEDITHVVNYDFPRNIEEYVHRVGRTGRAGRTGISLSFFTRSDWGVAAELIKILEEAQQEVPHEVRDMATRFAARRDRGGGSYNSSNRRW
ncbi:probable ATP-dependent RNA helicase DDX43 [Anopheles nili]|uniref:probable ATP-dependent RNA helicase DDX43 n=1 Tax=Anopheles nili TaxID=185578 RepID=UPI00237C11FA|nr:probable ATP-dependent RNA helicase DDX43 [Anopheles nili]